MSDEGFRELLNRLHGDGEDVDKTDIDELEAEIDEAVYGFYDLTPDKREDVEDYLVVF